MVQYLRFRILFIPIHSSLLFCFPIFQLLAAKLSSPLDDVLDQPLKCEHSLPEAPQLPSKPLDFRLPKSQGYPCSSSIYRWIFHHKPSISEYPHFFGSHHVTFFRPYQERSKKSYKCVFLEQVESDHSATGTLRLSNMAGKTSNDSWWIFQPRFIARAMGKNLRGFFSWLIPWSPKLHEMSPRPKRDRSLVLSDKTCFDWKKAIAATGHLKNHITRLNYI